MRVTFEPGAAAGAHSHPGATVYHIELGSLVFTLVEGQAMLMRVGTMATPDAAESIELGTEIVLNAGDTVFYEGDAVQTEVNNGDEPAVILIANIRGADEPARQPAGTPAT
jgi:quercetin dioxygenase-like cupin family protein